VFHLLRVALGAMSVRLAMKCSGWLALLFAGCFATLTASQAGTYIALTKHNLTPSGPGNVRTSEPSGLCVFCHTPHNALATIGLWNRNLPATTYTLYASTTLQSVLNQPTGSSRLCLSCHDGTIALDSLRVPPRGGPLLMSALQGRTALGTDLSGSHPISFSYDIALATKKPELVDPASLPASIRLDDNKQVQCTSCHDPHEDKQPNFLRTDNRGGALCTACHKPNGWRSSDHANSIATWNRVGTNPWPKSTYTTVVDNGCLNCHLTHGAGHPERLLAKASEPENCTVCHGGTVANKNIASEFNKPYRHPINDNQWTHDPIEPPQTMARHVTCSDCHNAHAATSTSATLPVAPGPLRGVKSVTQSGSVIPDPAFEYEVCNKCHGLNEPTTIRLTRQSASRNIRTKINPGNPSFHPIAAPGKNPTMQGLEAPYTTSSLISCISCHNNDSWTATGTNPKGPHGSMYDPILVAQYKTSDPSVESYQNYALCYQCHNQTYLITDQATTFPHRRHVVTSQASCATCHDAHGSSQNARLINFMLRDGNGTVVVSPSASTGQLSYTSLGIGHGQCSLSCHGYDHKPSKY
jgi:predicted CXXCH cytochrome family protein